MSGQASLVAFVEALPQTPEAEDFLAVVGQELRPAYANTGLAFPTAFDDAMVALAERAGVTANDDDRALAAKIVGWLKAHPFPSDWAVKLAQLGRTMAAEGSGDSRKSLEKLGLAVTNVIGQGSVPDGAKKASPFARFQLHADFEKKR